MTEQPTPNDMAEQLVNARIAAVRRKKEQQRQRRAEVAEMREHGLAARKRAKMRRWADETPSLHAVENPDAA